MIKYSERFREKKLKRMNKNSKYNADKKQFLLDEKTPFAITEAFRNLKAALSVSIPEDHDGGVAIMVSSSFPQDGKTTVTANLSLMFAQSEAKVVVVDADIRKGRLAKYFKMDTKPGLSDYLSGLCTVEDVLKQSPVNENLYVVSCGTSSPKPYELLESQRMKDFVKQLKEKFDYVLFDTPPILLVSDALAVAPCTDGAVLVCRHYVSHVADIVKSINIFDFAKVNILGVVVNDYKIPKSVKYKRYKKYSDSEYPYGYGESRDFEEATKDKANEEK
jgi:capsular exopolysaccharide synthesis family protein